MLKVAIITGAGRGIGRALALGLVRDGFRVAGVARTSSELKSLEKECNELSPSSIYISNLDVSDREAVKKFLEDVANRWGRVDVLVNNAGISRRGTSKVSYKDFKSMLDINLIGAFNFIQGVTPLMRRQKSGHIVNVSSIAGKTPFADTGAYSATKAALNALTESLFKELASEGISVSSICPSWVDTAMATASGLSHKKMIQPEDILQAVRFLLSLTPAAIVPEIVIYCRSAI